MLKIAHKPVKARPALVRQWPEQVKKAAFRMLQLGSCGQNSPLTTISFTFPRLLLTVQPLAPQNPSVAVRRTELCLLVRWLFLVSEFSWLTRWTLFRAHSCSRKESITRYVQSHGNQSLVRFS